MTRRKKVLVRYAIVALAVISFGAGQVMALICNNKDVPVQTDYYCGPQTQCSGWTGQAECEANSYMDPEKNNWGDCQPGTDTQYCFNAISDALAYTTKNCEWNTTNSKCEMAATGVPTEDRPKALYPCTPGS